MIRSVFLAAVIVLGASYGASGPYTLWIWWPESAVPETRPSSNRGACELMAQRVQEGWFASPAQIVEKAWKAECRPGDTFPKGWDCIKGFNCR